MAGSEIRGESMETEHCLYCTRLAKVPTLAMGVGGWVARDDDNGGRVVSKKGLLHLAKTTQASVGV